jgi:tryptophanyl-tRNA synthetase
MRIISGIRSTSDLHIGNYLGAIKNWLDLQKDNECIFFIADLHALSTPWDPKELQRNVFETAVAYLSAGLDPEKCILFVQSHVKEHSELTWLLNNITPIGELNRMTQFKDKSKQFKTNINAGLFDYPVLMAADILLYQTEAVPVGKDQVQHVELTRSIAKRFNQKFGETFKIPEPFVPKIGEKIMSLQEPKKKMSKTDPDQTRINLFDEPEQIRKKIMSAVTDTGKSIKYSPATKPGVSNLLTIYSLFSNKPIKDIEKEFDGKGYGDFKKALVELLVEKLEPFRRKRKELMSREVYIKDILEKGAQRARVIAGATLDEVKKKMGLL